MARIMLVDDSAIVRKNLRAILESVGHEIVAEAYDGKDVLDIYAKCNPDLVTMDIGMPIIDGITALKLLVRTDLNARVVMISALGQKTKVLEAITIGAKSFIIKPFEKDKVIEVINNVLKK